MDQHCRIRVHVGPCAVDQIAARLTSYAARTMGVRDVVPGTEGLALTVRLTGDDAGWGSVAALETFNRAAGTAFGLSSVEWRGSRWFWPRKVREWTEHESRGPRSERRHGRYWRTLDSVGIQERAWMLEPFLASSSRAVRNDAALGLLLLRQAL